MARAAANPAGPPPITQTSSASSRGASRVARGASGSVPAPPISRTSFRNRALPVWLPVIIVWWSIPSGNSQSAAPSRSMSALGKAFWRAQASSARAGVTQARWFGRPSIRKRQAAQWPSRQKKPRGRWYFEERASVSIPAACNATATGSPAKAGTADPSKSMVMGRPRGAPGERSRRSGDTCLIYQPRTSDPCQEIR